MNVIALSAFAWTHQRDRAMQLVQRVAGASGGATLVIDRAAVARETAAIAPTTSFEIEEIVFSKWLKAGFVDGGVLDVHAIRSVADGIPSDRIVLVDARSHRPDLITGALGHLRHAWFPLDEWHPAFVVIFDDIHLLSLGEALSGTFYCQPKLLTDVETNRLLRPMMRRATLLRWLGPGYLRWQHDLYYRVFHRIANWTDRRAERLEVRG